MKITAGLGVRLRKLLAGTVLAVLLCAGSGVSRALDDPDMEPHTSVGQQMPAFSVKTLAGPEFSLAAMKGKVVVVNFWATWCGPCKLEMPALQKDIWEKHKGEDGFAMIAIAREQRQETVAAFQAQHKEYTFPLAFDPERATYKLFADAGIPRTYVVDRRGRIVFQSMGADPEDFDKMKRSVKKALAEK